MEPASIESIHDAVACLQRLTELFRQRRQELAAAVGLTEQQWAVLEEIATDHFMPSLFARRRESSPAAVSKILRQLLDKELVLVSLNRQDGRQRQYVLSESGLRVLAQVRAHRTSAIEAVWRPFRQEDVQQFTRFGQELLERLQTYSRQGGPVAASGQSSAPLEGDSPGESARR